MKQNQNLVTKYKYLSSVFDTFSKSQQKSFIDHLTDEQAKYLIEICTNAYFKNVDLCSKDVKLLEKHKNKIKKIATSKIGFKKKKKIMTGGFISVILKTIASTLIPLLVDKLVETFKPSENEQV